MALPFDALGWAPWDGDRCLRLLTHPHGVFLVVGPTGSGKTTTLHAILGFMNTVERKIVTAEDPVEITQPGLQQVQCMPKIGYTFAVALRAFLRCGPDIILIGEMRDLETASAGIEASLTGHLVFSTLHTNSAPETITRLLDMGLDPLNFADAFIAVVAQRLMRTLCKKCKEPYKPEQEEIDKLLHFFGEEYIDDLKMDFDNLELNRPVGCDKCGGTGYAGRAGVHEILEATPEMKKLISAGTTVTDIRKLALSQGMRLLEQCGIYRVLTGMTDLVNYRKMAGGGH
jgi:type II secretory ATPase GspE/PulE/Tfp pilus assembly ATPase PilB-like protein